MENMNNNKNHSDDLGEVSFVDFLIILLKYKKMIIFVPMICVLFGIGYFYITGKKGLSDKKVKYKNVKYYSECLIEPLQNNEKKISLILFRRNFVLSMIEENGLLADIQKLISDEKITEQIPKNQIGKQEIYQWFRKNIYISPVDDVIKIGFTAAEKDIPPKVIRGILNSLNNFFGQIDLETITQELNSLSQQLATTKDPELKEKISEKIAIYLIGEIKIKNTKQYIFKLLDPPSLAEKVEVFESKKERRIEPLESLLDTSHLTSNARSKHTTSRYVIILFLIIISSFAVAITIAFFREYISKIKLKNPEKFAELKKYFSFR